MGFDSVEKAIEDIKAGKIIIITDDEDRENEGDLVMAAEKATPDAINFMAKYGRGLICVPIESKRLDELDIRPMVEKNRDNYDTAFTVSVDAGNGITTGISAADRARTIQVLIDSSTKSEDLVCPGHIFPLRAKDGGLLFRAGHTEASVDLARLSGLYPAGVICEIMNDDGSMARFNDLVSFKKKHGFTMCSIGQIISYRRKNEKLIEKSVVSEIPTEYGLFKVVAYRSLVDNLEHVALFQGNIASEEPVLVRVHSECLTGDLFGSLRCDCGPQLQQSIKNISKEKRGAIVYMRQEGRGIGLMNKLRAYNLQDGGLDTVEANIHLGFEPDLREYGVGAQILNDLGINKVKLMTNNPKKIIGLEGYGIEIVDIVPLHMPETEHNRRYLKAKKEKMGHMLPDK
ncbi:MAG: bifunctional 3,4-dihydroxy-2-butanone-4-phosphate synthase/GTP cyclohydrolase II [Candidatus Theseobacter exili]|nr:bifunctional 3,4-dihydroxy-2-butanone-4-phosphate synthase/GTP cyclohydrolase II [Candidatus Theseobacter exili]